MRGARVEKKRDRWEVEQLKLLIIEDDQDQRELIQETIEERFGAGTVVAVDSRRAALEQDLASFDLILSDYNLPDANGIQLLGEIKAICNTPVIMVTGENVGRIATEAIRSGATDYVVKFGDYLFTIPLVVEKNLTVAKMRRENEQLRLEVERALSEVREKNLQLEQSLKKIEEVAATDPLTGLYNRRHFGKVLEQLFSEAQRYDTDMACVMIDLDGYKQLNDGYGHQVGDQLLVMAGKVISANMRKMDVAARYGGDEFVLLLPRAAGDEAARVAHRIREEVRQGSCILLRRNEGMTISVGIGSIHGDRPAGTEQLIAAADAALYRAKAAGRNRVVVSGSAGVKA
ncbi:MAG: putative response regulator receiver protein [Phycisphaerales bacterium]|jgi:two-component system cell cycle response regulator|nr:putative response regulator receiver protein [Phycisphaerales bacterium]MDB5301924.1 putative response regulator receiver protein [Phycisphaerales bacterium]MDB5303104.1 putative response regulator receiver protein [Phycisphaerales bacterium]